MDSPVTLRPARPEDVVEVAAMINHYAAQDLMLPRSEKAIQQSLDDFVIASLGDRVMGCGALARLSPDLAEIRSIAVSPECQGQGLGRVLVLHLLDRARQDEFSQVCALTLVPDFFTRLGFHAVDRWAISPKVWQECVFCPKFHRCDEVTVVYDLKETDADLTMPVAAWENLVAAFARRADLRSDERDGS